MTTPASRPVLKQASYLETAPYEGAALYQFPFVPLDPIPGGSNLGRIEWHIEVLKARKPRHRIGGLLVWASQTRDPRYEGVFHIEGVTEQLTQSRFAKQDGNEMFCRAVWRIGFCREHGNIVLSAYPKNYHRSLVVKADSNISWVVAFSRREARP